jgi:hypothetical protein
MIPSNFLSHDKGDNSFQSPDLLYLSIARRQNEVLEGNHTKECHEKSEAVSLIDVH